MNTYFPTLLEKDPSEDFFPESLFAIQPFFEIPQEASEDFYTHLESTQKLLLRILPEDIMQFAETISSPEDTQSMQILFQKIIQKIPHVFWTQKSKTVPSTISVTTLCEFNYTQGIGRSLGDLYTRWLLPGKNLYIVYMRSMTFTFKKFSRHPFYMQEMYLQIDNKKDLNDAYENLNNLSNKIKINISAVQHARKIIAATPLSFNQKKIIIQEHIISLLHNSFEPKPHWNIFDQMHHLIIKVSANETERRMKEQISFLMKFQPEIFKNDIFPVLQNLIFLCRDTFLAKRAVTHLRRLVSYTYLFKKLIKHEMLQNPQQRQLYIKLIQTKLATENHDPVLGVFVMTNILQDNEVIGEKHVFEAISSITPNAEKVSESTWINKDHEKIHSIYLEIQKPEGRFSKKEIRDLRSKLAKEIKDRIEIVINPMFMAKNDEELMRNILILSQQLKHPKDIPQVIISFQKQTNQRLYFTVILLRVLLPESESLTKLFATPPEPYIKFQTLETKQVGKIRKKYTKEAYVFDVKLKKKRFLRKDYSIDLNQARESVYASLTKVIGRVRDYNGGMISKQIGVLNSLKKLLLQAHIRNDFLLENFFYSLSPHYMQSILPPDVLKPVFLLILEALENDYTKDLYFLRTQIISEHFILVLGGINPSIKEHIDSRVEEMEFAPSTFTSSYMHIHDVSCLSYILKFKDSEEHEKFSKNIIKNVSSWKNFVQKNIDIK